MQINFKDYQDLYYLLRDQIDYIPIEVNQYLFNITTYQIYSIELERHLVITDGDKVNLKTMSNKPRFSYNRIVCYIQNGLHENMKHIDDKSFVCVFEEGRYCWLSVREHKQRENLLNLQQVWLDHPELNEREGFYDEGLIHFKGYPGFYIVPTTNGTLALNPLTKQAIFTYSKVLLKIQQRKRGEEYISLNVRLSGKTMIMLHRAIAYLTITLPARYMELGRTLGERIAKLEVDHINAIPSNNAIPNLQYLTSKENLIKKLEQEGDPRVFPTTWKSPTGELVRFRSLRLAAEIIGCSVSTMLKAYKGWKDNILNIKDWVMISDRPESLYNYYYHFFANNGVSKEDLAVYKNGVMVYAVNNNENQIYVYKDLRDFCSMKGLGLSSVQSHLAYKGPLEPYHGMVIFPLKHEKLMRESGYLKTFFIQNP